jgi:hypothetical protein
MRVLNLDLDFFLNDRVTNRPDDPNRRPDDRDLVPWQAEDVVSFLENELNLKKPIPGKVVVSHHEVFFEWRTRIERDALTTPFFICHVDAHSDMGLGFPSWVYLHSDFLELPLIQRRYPQEGDWGLNFGSFMSFAIGNRWFSDIDFVVPPFWKDDIGQNGLADDSLTRDMLKAGCQVKVQLMHAPREQIEACVRAGRSFTKIRRDVGEPIVPLNILPRSSIAGRYDVQEWDFAFLSHSPGYVPRAADSLRDVIGSYIQRS